MLSRAVWTPASWATAPSTVWTPTPSSVGGSPAIPSPLGWGRRTPGESPRNRHDFVVGYRPTWGARTWAPTVCFIPHSQLRGVGTGG